MSQTNAPGCATGFTGTIPALLDWIQSSEAGITINISKPQRNLRQINPIYKIRQITIQNAGTKINALLQRIAHDSHFGNCYWQMTSRGNIFSFEVPDTKFNSTHEQQWIAPVEQGGPAAS